MEWKGKTKEISRYLGEGTTTSRNSRRSSRLQQVKNRRVPVRVHTDSAYAIGVLSEGWKVKENRELVTRIQALMRDFTDLALREGARPLRRSRATSGSTSSRATR
jgi:ribonuclease HI